MPWGDRVLYVKFTDDRITEFRLLSFKERSAMGKTIPCHACGARMARDVRPDSVTYKGRSVAIDQPGWYCTKCDEVVLDGPDSAVIEEAFVALKAEVDGILTPHEVARIRTRLGLSQRQAGALLGGGPRSFQKYESRTDWITRSMANLLRLLDRDPARLKELAAVRVPRREPGTTKAAGSTKGRGAQRQTHRAA